MARPESISDVKRDDRMTVIANFKIERILSDANLLKHYTNLLQAVQKMGGEASKSYDSVDFLIPKDKKQLEEQLRHDQYYWDEYQKLYNIALNRGPNSDEVPEWRRNGVKEWAKQEELPDPFDVFAANDPELNQLRMELGMEDSE